MADSEYTVYALNTGTVIRKLIKDGDKVKKGQLLYVLRHTGSSAKMEAASSVYANARQNLSANSSILNDLKITMQNADLKFSNDSLLYSRYKNLWAQNIGTRVNLDNAETQYNISFNQKRSAKEKYYSTRNDLQLALKNAQSQAESLKSDLDNYFIRAENPGTVYETLKENGEAVKMSEAVALMGRSDSRIIKLAVDQQDIDQIKPGQTVLLKTDVSGERIFKAQVIRTYPVMNEADQTFRVDAVFIDAAAQSYIHSSVEANIIVNRRSHSLTIPINMLMNGDTIRIKQQNRVITKRVKAGIRTLSEVEILSGADEHTEIVNPDNK
ncbi:macrolide transporter subunit MacA [Mucilaginibacter boryungensis]